MADFYPQNMDALAAWHDNFVNQLGPLATKYNIPAATVTQAEDDNDWMTYWVDLRHAADTFKQQLTKYFNDIKGNDPTLMPPATPVPPGVLGAPADPPPPGIEFRTREIANQIKGHIAYAAADGEALGIVGPESGPEPEGTLKPDIALRTLANFELEATFSKKGNDALKLQFRHAGGDWKSAGFLVASPGTFAIAPSVAGTAEQIEIRAIYILKNNEVGNYSDAKSAFIAP